MNYLPTSFCQHNFWTSPYRIYHPQLHLCILWFSKKLCPDQSVCPYIFLHPCLPIPVPLRNLNNDPLLLPRIKINREVLHSILYNYFTVVVTFVLSMSSKVIWLLRGLSKMIKCCYAWALKQATSRFHCLIWNFLYGLLRFLSRSF